MPTIETLIQTLKDWRAKHEADDNPHPQYAMRSSFDALMDEVKHLKSKLASVTDNYVESDDIEADDATKNYERDTD